MKLTLLGGGAFRNLPIVRNALASPALLTDGSIYLYDLNPARAEAMGRMIQRTPEYAAVRCPVVWDAPVETALEGADAVNISFPCGSLETGIRSGIASRKLGFMSSDQLSPTGSMLALYGGPIILNYARLMERYCPAAWFIIFANPVAVYSALVNNHTRIRALGVCGGFANHMWDLTRLMGREAQEDVYDLDVAGINHLSFILRGAVRGEELFSTLARFIGPGWKPPRVTPHLRWLATHIRFGLRKLIDLIENFGVTIFSTEGDGMAHLFYEEMFERGRQEDRLPTRAQFRRMAAQQAHTRIEADRTFHANLDQALPAAFWAQQTRAGTHFGRDDHGVTGRILRALGGIGSEKIVASHPNRGAVAGFPARTALEYSFTLRDGTLTPTPDLYIPAPFHGMLSALAMHQTLVADAIADEDPRTLFHALYAYPIKQNTRDSRALFRALLEIHREEMPVALRATKSYL